VPAGWRVRRSYARQGSWLPWGSPRMRRCSSPCRRSSRNDNRSDERSVPAMTRAIEEFLERPEVRRHVCRTLDEVRWFTSVAVEECSGAVTPPGRPAAWSTRTKASPSRRCPVTPRSNPPLARGRLRAKLGLHGSFPHTVAIAVVGLACNGPDATSSEFTMSGGTPPAGTSSGESSSTTGSSSSTSGSSSGSSSTDRQFRDLDDRRARSRTWARSPTSAARSGCKGKIDFLFVISRAWVMGPSQDKLVAAAPDFIATIQDQFDDFDLHIMVVDSEERWWVLKMRDLTSARPPATSIRTIPAATGRRNATRPWAPGLSSTSDRTHVRHALRARRTPLHHQGHPGYPGGLRVHRARRHVGQQHDGRCARGAISPKLNAFEPCPRAATPGSCAMTRSSC
jgi:hypothetical protein